MVRPKRGLHVRVSGLLNLHQAPIELGHSLETLGLRRGGANLGLGLSQVHAAFGLCERVVARREGQMMFCFARTHVESTNSIQCRDTAEGVDDQATIQAIAGLLKSGMLLSRRAE